MREKKQFVILDEREDMESGSIGDEPSCALVDQIRMVSRLRIKNKSIATLNQKALARIEQAIVFVLDLKNIAPSETEGGSRTGVNPTANVS